MSFTVRIYGHQGIVPLKVVEGEAQFRADSVFQLKQPYLWTQSLTASGTAVSSTAAAVPTGYTLDPTTILRIEVPDGQTIRYEVNPPGRSTAATANSPLLSGRDQIQFGSAWTISVMDATGT